MIWKFKIVGEKNVLFYIKRSHNSNDHLIKKCYIKYSFCSYIDIYMTLNILTY